MREVVEFNFLKVEIEVVINEKVGYFFIYLEEKIVRVILEVFEEFGEKVELVEGFGVVDLRFFMFYGVKVIDFGLRGGNIYGLNEYVEIDLFCKMLVFYVELVRRLVRE